MALPKSFCKEQDNVPPPHVFFSREILRMGEKGMKDLGCQFAALTLIATGLGLMAYQPPEFKKQVLDFVRKHVEE